MIPLMDEALERYAADHTTALGPLFDELREVTLRETTAPQMQVGRVEGRLLSLLVAVTGARFVLEVGTFTGYSALAMASALGPKGRLVTCDVDERTSAIAQSFFDRSGHGDKIEIVVAPALETIAKLSPDPPIDLAFIDADKENYLAYYEAILPRLRPGGLLVADNTLWSGRVLAPEDETTRAICAFNDRVAADERVTCVLLTVRDGILVARKR